MVLLPKQFMSSAALCQPPFLILPAERIGRLSGIFPQPLPKNPLSQNQKHEYNKTAALISQDPWGMRRAAEYLNGWVVALARHSGAFEPFVAMSVCLPVCVSACLCACASARLRVCVPCAFACLRVCISCPCVSACACVCACLRACNCMYACLHACVSSCTRDSESA